MEDVSSALFAEQEVRKNFVKSGILVVVLMCIAFGLSYWIGIELGNPANGLLIGAVIALIVIPIQILTAKYAILGMARGRAANPENPDERRAIHTLEGLAISAGLKRTPDLYIVPSQVPNAFASGLSESSAFVAITQGLLDMMEPAELEGVIGHEIAHIVHRDIMLNQLVVGLISVILLLAFVLERVMFFKSISGGRRDRENNGAGGLIALLIIVAILIRPIAQLIAALLQMSISRKREYAADAYSVRLCSYNEGLANALAKLGGHKYNAKDVESLGGKELACMYINFPGGELFSTHPPIDERIRRIRNMY